MSQKGMTYEGVGVNYDAMDPFKRACQLAARDTAHWLERLGLQEEEWSRGESVYLMRQTVYEPYQRRFWGHTHEGLGTKNLVADKMEELMGKPYYAEIAQDTVAMGVNDIITGGVMPALVAMHLAVGDSGWFNGEARVNSLVQGWADACNLSRCAWSGGETPTLRDVVCPGASELSCSVVGSATHEDKIIRWHNIQPGDAIVLLVSSGIHANGLTLARRIADKLHDGYLTDIGMGKTYGEALLSPTVIYVPIVDDCQAAGIPIHYAINITGHGWRKLMRAEGAFTYVLDRIPEPPTIFHFIQEHGPVDDKEAYGNLNMGAGFALIVPRDRANDVIRIAGDHGIGAMWGGYVDASPTHEGAPQKRVVLNPVGIEWTGEALGVR